MKMNDLYVNFNEGEYEEYFDKMMFDDTCTMTEEEYEKELKREQQEIDDSFHNNDFLESLRLIKLGIQYNFNLEKVFIEILNDYDYDEDEKTEILDYCNELTNLSKTLNDKIIKNIDEICFINEDVKKNCKYLNCYTEKLEFCLVGGYLELQEEIYCIDRDSINEKLQDEIKYLNRKLRG